MGALYHVHEFAERAGVTVKALHHYDRLGLLKPRRTDAGYRLYADSDLERLEQIVALKFVGLSLKQIKVVLDREALPLPDALRLQREALNEQRRRLDRAIDAIEDAEARIPPERASDASVLKTLIEVIGMHDQLDVMKKYFSEDAWAEARHHYERWPSQLWRDLYRDVEAALGEDPASERGRALAARWLALSKRDAGGHARVRAGLMRAWIDRDQWPAVLQQRIAEFNLERIASFINKAGWALGEAERRKHGTGEFRAPDRFNEARIAFFRDVEAALGEDPAGEKARGLVDRWNAMLEDEADGDPAIKSWMRKAWAGRRDWPPTFTRYVASLYLMEPETWEAVADFIERASASGLGPAL